MNHNQLARVSIADLVKSGDLSAQTVLGWQKQGLDISIHPENLTR